MRHTGIMAALVAAQIMLAPFSSAALPMPVDIPASTQAADDKPPEPTPTEAGPPAFDVEPPLPEADYSAVSDDKDPTSVGETVEAEATEPEQRRATEQPLPSSSDESQTTGEAQREATSDDQASLIGGGMIVGLILLVVVALGATKALADHTAERYGWPLIMNWWNALYLVGGAVLMWSTFVFGEPSLGWVVFAGCWLIVLVVNIVKTNLIIGTLMTIIQPVAVLMLWLLFQLLRAKAGGQRA